MMTLEEFTNSLGSYSSQLRQQAVPPTSALLGSRIDRAGIRVKLSKISMYVHKRCIFCLFGLPTIAIAVLIAVRKLYRCMVVLLILLLVLVVLVGLLVLYTRG